MEYYSNDGVVKMHATSQWNLCWSYVYYLEIIDNAYMDVKIKLSENTRNLRTTIWRANLRQVLRKNSMKWKNQLYYKFIYSRMP